MITINFKKKKNILEPSPAMQTNTNGLGGGGGRAYVQLYN